jgi:hypothetical protein
MLSLEQRFKVGVVIAFNKSFIPWHPLSLIFHPHTLNTHT